MEIHHERLTYTSEPVFSKDALMEGIMEHWNCPHCGRFVCGCQWPDRPCTCPKETDDKARAAIEEAKK